MPSFSWLTALQANQEVSVRLGDPNQVFWTKLEIYQYLYEALRVWNALTAAWPSPGPTQAGAFSVALTPPFTQNWFPANATGSPRLPTLTDNDVYTLIEYHLLEPPTGSVWTGTNQFNITDLAQAMSRRRNEILQAAACNMVESTLAMTPNTSTAQVTDLVLDERRCRWVPAAGQGSPVTLQRGDSRTFQYFTPNYRQTTANPLRWDVIGSPPQTITVDTLVNVPSTIQALGIQGGPDFTPGTNKPLLMPDDWMWVLKFGAMADILSMEQEGKDLPRATYCRQRYTEGLKLMAHMPWLLQAFLQGVPVDTQPLAGADRTNYEWQSRATAFPEIVVGGIDCFAVSPIPTVLTTAGMTVVGNAPIPANDAAEIQVPRDVMNAILDEAQHLALFKMGGAEFSQSMVLHKSFVEYAVNQNRRLRESGILSTTIRPPVDRQDEEQPRYAGKEK
jgi:hypothetical protein